MNKNTRLLSIFFIIQIITICSICNPQVTATTNSVHYKITRTRLLANIGQKSMKTNQFQMNEVSYPEKTKIDTTTNINSNGVFGNYTIGTNSKYYYWPTSMLKLVLPIHLEEVHRITFKLFKYWEFNEGIKNGLNLYIYPYISPSPDTWNYFKNLGIAMNNTYNQYSNQDHEVQFDYSYTENDRKIIFEYWGGGTINGSYGEIFGYNYNLQSSVTFDNLFKIVIDKYSGIIYGLGIKGRVQGIINQTKVNVQLDYCCELENYHLSSYSIGPAFYVNPYLDRNLAIIIPISILFVGFTIGGGFLFRKKVKRRNISKSSGSE